MTSPNAIAITLAILSLAAAAKSSNMPEIDSLERPADDQSGRGTWQALDDASNDVEYPEVEKYTIYYPSGDVVVPSVITSFGNGNGLAEHKRAWKSMNVAWGKRKAADWNKFRGAWGKREPGWNNLKGLWGKRGGDWNKLQAAWGKRSD